MTTLEAEKFIDLELKSLWPDWKATSAQVRIWSGMLVSYAYDDAQWAAEQIWREGGNRRKSPAFDAFTGCVAKFRPAREQGTFKDSLWAVYCNEGPRKGTERSIFPRKMHLQDDREYMGKLCQEMVTAYKDLYGGEWIVIQREPKTIIDDELMGPEAKEKAEKMILDGPDTPGRQFLERHLAGKQKNVLKMIDEVAPAPDLAAERNRQTKTLDKVPF